MMITFLAFSFRSYFSSPSLWLNTSQLWEWNFKQSLGWERYVSFQDRDTITMQSVDACWGGQRSQTDHRYNKYRTRQSRRPAVSHCHFLWHVDEVLLSLISRSWSGLYGDKLVLTHKNTQTHSFQDSLRAISWAMQFVESAGGGGVTVRPAGQAPAGVVLCVPVWVFQCTYTGCQPVFFPRGLCERTETWCCFLNTTCGGVCMRCPCCIFNLWAPPPPTHPTPPPRDYRRQARCNCSLRYAGWTSLWLPRASHAPDIEWCGHQEQLYLGGGGRQSIIHKLCHNWSLEWNNCFFCSHLELPV